MCLSPTIEKKKCSHSQYYLIFEKLYKKQFECESYEVKIFIYFFLTHALSH